MKKQLTQMVAMLLLACLLSGCGSVNTNNPANAGAETTAAPAETEAPEETTESADTEMTPSGLITLTGYEINTEITVDMFRQFVSFETTEAEVISLVGLPYGWLDQGYIGYVYLTSDGRTVEVYYTIKFGESVVNMIMTPLEDDPDRTHEMLVEKNNPYGIDLWPTGFEINEEITLEMFKQFKAGESTQADVEGVVGQAHAFMGSGLLYYMYYTSDGHLVGVVYTTKDGAQVIDAIQIYREDGTREKLTQ